MEDGTTTAIWNLESLLVTPEGKETREHRLQIWPFIGHTLMTWIDGFCLVMALLPPATLILIDLTLLTTYWNAALSMIVLLTLSLCAQIGLLQKFQSKQPLKFASYGSTDQGQLYSGVFLTITSNQEEDHIKIRPNATGQVYLSEECQFGPYL